MMNNDQVLDKLQYLLGTLRDGEKGFADAAEQASDAKLKALFSERASQRRSMAGDIESRISALGEKPRESGSVGAALHRTWINVRDALSGRDDHAVVAEVVRGESVAVDNYQDVLGDAELPADLRALVQAQFAQVKASHEQFAAMKDGA